MPCRRCARIGRADTKEIDYQVCRKIYSKGSQTLRRSADCNITVLHCVIYIMGGQIRMKAIIYTSNTGSTAEYAQLLGKELNLPVHSLQQAKNKVLSGSVI